MFIEQGIRPENMFWKYIVGSILIIMASFVGQIPMLIGIVYETLVNKNAIRVQMKK